MPKKGKVNKLARMSDEERARYLQHRADMEEEARRRKIELISRFIKNKLVKEETYSKMNTAKLNQSWRYILRTVKCNQMVLDIKGIQNSFNYLMEKKDRLLNGLLQAIEDADEQHRRCFQAHTENISYFLNIGSERLEKLQYEYEQQKNSLLETWDKDYYDIGDNQNKSEFKLQLIIFLQDNDFKNYKKHKELQDATTKNDARLEHQEEMWDLRRPKQLQVEYYWHQLKQVYQTYLDTHSPYIQHYHTLLEKDEFYQRDMARNEILIQKATESLMKLQNEWVKSTSLSNHKINKINKKKDQLTKKYSQLKKCTKMEQLNNTEYFTNMVQVSQDAIERLEEVKTKLNKILQIAEICKKYEIEEDKFTGLIREEKKEDENIFYEHLNSDMIDEYKEYSKLDKFFHKLNTVRIQNMCLKAEKIKIQKENVQVKTYMKKYLTELALKNDTEHGRPYSVKLKTTEKKLTGVNLKINRPVTCIEGVLSNAVQHEKRMKILERKHKEMGGIRSYPRLQCWM